MKRYYADLSKHFQGVNFWDMLALLLMLAILTAFAFAAKNMATPYHLGESIKITLDPSVLPYYALRSVLRIAVALLISLFFTLIIGTVAAKSQRAEKLILAIVDVFQSVPVLAFQAIAVVPFIRLFQGSLLGPECASIIAIVTAQIWNMILSFYQSLRNLPEELKDTGRMLHLSPWQRFWKIEVPFSIPSLLWNTMISVSASWFFVVATEAIAVSNQDIHLPGIGSYLALAIDQANILAVVYAIVTVLLVIFIYDQILFRPLMYWSEKFYLQAEVYRTQGAPWFLKLLRRTSFWTQLKTHIERLCDRFLFFQIKRIPQNLSFSWNLNRAAEPLWNGILTLILLFSLGLIWKFVTENIDLLEIFHVFALGAVTLVRVIVLIIIASFIWVPVGVYIGQSQKISHIIQPIVQFISAIPANIFFPPVVFCILKFHLNPEIWVSPLMILGSQWYLLFNIIVGASMLPRELHLAASNFGLKRWLWWKRFVLPGIFPYYITGAITAAGGAWNASIIAEFVTWGNHNISATGLGAYISAVTHDGDFPRITLGTAMMCLYVLILNRLLWVPLYELSERRFRIT